MYRIETFTDGLPADARAIRLAVFCDEQGYSPQMEFDAADRTALHFVVYDGAQAVATGRVIREDDATYYLGRIAVGKAYRGCGLGRLLVEAMAEEARRRGAQLLKLGAQTRARGFYEKLGFRAAGEEYPDGHVPHVPMERRI